MKVGILGSGEVGQALGEGFLKHGHEVMLGTGSPAKLAEWSAKNAKAKIGSFSQAASFGELVVLAVKGVAAIKVLRSAGKSHLAGKTVIDVTNPIADAPAQDGVLKFFTTLDDSLMERLQREFPEARFVKAFNTVGSDFMVDPKFPDGKPTMFYCGDDEAAKKTVERLLREFGWETSDMGSSAGARAIEPLCLLWCIPGFLRDEWSHAFKLLKSG